MKVKTSDLAGKALDWFVCKLENPELYLDHFMAMHRHYKYDVGTYEYSTSWTDGGPIIEREKISIIPARNGWKYYWAAECGDQEAYESFGPQGDRYDNAFHIDGTHSGEAPLIAAMRCYVASKLGDVVDVPDELMVSS